MVTENAPLATATIDESGISGFAMTAWSGLIAPAGVPAVVVTRLNTEFNNALALPAVREKLIAMGLEPTGGTPEQFDQTCAENR